MATADRASGYLDRFDYRVDILRRRNLVTAIKDGIPLARSDRTLLLDEQDHGLVFYFPRRDVRLDRLVTMPDKTSRCPFKGEASYWRLAGGAEEAIAWSYDAPYPEVAVIAQHIAFYQDQVTVSIGTAATLHGGPAGNRI